MTAEAPRDALADIDAAVELRREVIDVSPADYPDPAGLLSSLGAALTLRAVIADSCGRPEQATADSAEALDLHRAAARLVPETHPYAFRILGNLCRALLEQAHDLADLDEAIDLARGTATSPLRADNPSGRGNDRERCTSRPAGSCGRTTISNSLLASGRSSGVRGDAMVGLAVLGQDPVRVGDGPVQSQATIGLHVPDCPPGAAVCK